jgi:hypothetical protein
MSNGAAGGIAGTAGLCAGGGTVAGAAADWAGGGAAKVGVDDWAGGGGANVDGGIGSSVAGRRGAD